MNIQADDLAKSHNQHLRNSDDLETLDLKDEIGPIRITSGQQLLKISSNFRSSMYDAITQSATEDYWLRKLKIDPVMKSTINWEHMGKAFTEISKEKGSILDLELTRRQF